MPALNIDWEQQPLGQMPDRVLAIKLGCARDTVYRARHRMGVEAYDVRGRDPLVDIGPGDLEDVRIDHDKSIAIWCDVMKQAFVDLRKSLVTVHSKTLSSHAVHRNKRLNAATVLDEVKYWLFESHYTGIGSFQWVCCALDLNESAVRSRARKIIMEYE